MFWKNKKIILVGSTGFVGSHLKKTLLLREPKEIIYISRQVGIDATNLSQLSDAVTDADIIINAAALDGDAEFKKENSNLIFNINKIIVSNILSVAKKSTLVG